MEPDIFDNIGEAIADIFSHDVAIAYNEDDRDSDAEDDFFYSV